MPEKLIGKASEFKDGERRIAFVGDAEIGVFRERGEFTPTATTASTRAGPPARA
jgi:hypothetical protein